MKRSWFSFSVVAGLLVLLGVLAFLQYRWLGQISESEREQMQRRLSADTAHFAEDFNREIQNAYFNFQLNADVWRERRWTDFEERYKFWSEKTAYPELVKNIYFVDFTADSAVSRYNRETKAFEPGELSPALANVKSALSAEGALSPVAAEIPALLMPVHDSQEKFGQILIRTAPKNASDLSPHKTTAARTEMPLPKKYGVLMIELDEQIIKEKILPDLAVKYFSDGENAGYNLAVTDNRNENVFQTRSVTATDATARLFELSPENFVFFSNRDVLSAIRGDKPQNMVVSRYETSSAFSKTKKTVTVVTGDGRQTVENAENANENPPRMMNPTSGETNVPPDRANGGRSRIELQLKNADGLPPQEQVRVFESSTATGEKPQIWTLNVQHNAGSLERFISNTRYKNLAVSFGILTLLGVSAVLIFLSAQRARLFAQRQVDFVSSVSHEFRTPLAVIYSAGENLADGVAKESGQVSRYGDLIKGEGKKLSAMVEQILDYAGADAGRKKYDLRTVNAEEIVCAALEECRPLLEGKNFSVETEIAENLPAVAADKTAIVQAVQNLIGNSIKYSPEEKFIKITAKNGDKTVKIAVEDKGLGIDKADLKHVFEPFFRARAVVDEQIHGSGLGLSLVKKTIDAHGGKIEVSSEIGKGSKFTIFLPAK